MTASTASLALPSLSPQTLALYTPKPASICLYSAASSALALGCKPISISASFLNSGKGFQSVLSRFVRNVAVSSEFEQDEEVIYDKTTGRSREFGFVTMSSVQEAESAARQLNGYVVRIVAVPPIAVCQE